MSYSIDSNKLGLYLKHNSSYLKADAGKQISSACFKFKKLWYSARQIAWQNRDKKAIFWNALQAGELEQFKRNVPGTRNSQGDYQNDHQNQFDLNRLNKYFWDSFAESWAEAVPLETAQNLHSLKDLKNAEGQLLKFVYQNWGDKLLGNYQPTPEPLAEKCRFTYYLEDTNITVKGKFTSDQREIILSSKGVNNIIIVQIKGEKHWNASIHLTSAVINSGKAYQMSQMLALASRLNIGIKDFIANPEQFLGLESARQLNQLYQQTKKVLLQINDDFLTKLHQSEKEKPQQVQLKETITPDVEPEEQAVEKPKLKKPQPRTQPEVEQWLQAHPELAEDFDAQLGLCTIDYPSEVQSDLDNLE